MWDGFTNWPSDMPQRFIGEGVAGGNEQIVGFQQIGVSVWDGFDGENFLDGVLEMHPADLAAGGEMDDSQAAETFFVLQACGDGDAAEDRRFADLG